MRVFLTGLSLLLIVALTAALVGPYLIDWNGQRAFIEARLSAVLGQKVTIGGAIDVKLLPTPYLVLGQTVIGSDEGPVTFSIHHLDLELSPTPLLHGEVDVTQARLVEPTIRVTLTPDRTLPALPDAPAFHADVSLDHIAVTGGTLAIADPASGRTFSLENLDFEADAASLAGPFKVAGTEGPEGATTAFRFSTAQAKDGRARAHLVVVGNAAHAGLDLDGTLVLTSAGRESVRQSFDGKVVVTGTLDESAVAPVAWTLSGPLKADPQHAALDGGELRLGGADRGLTLAASGTADLGASPHIDLDLAAQTLDLDRLAAPPQDETGKTEAKSPPPQLPPLSTLRRALAAATPPLPATVDVKVDTATWAGETLADLSAHLDVGGDGPRPISLAGDGPGGAHLQVDGKLGPERFDGKAALRANDFSRTVKWLSTIDASFPLKPSEVPAGAFRAAAEIAVAEGALAAKSLTLEAGGTRVAGTARLDPADGERAAKLTARLTAQSLDIPSLPDVVAWRGSARALDLDLALDAQAVRVAEAGAGSLATGRLRLGVTKSGRHLALTSLQAEDLGGATIEAQGTLDPAAAHLTAKVDAAHLEAAAALLRQLAPGDAAEAFADRAPALAPAKLALDAIWGTTPKGRLAPAKASLDGTLGATELNAAIGPDPDGEAGAVALRASLAAPEGTALLQQLGVPSLPIDALGAGKVTLAAHGKPDRPLDTKLDGEMGATHLEFTGPFRLLVSPIGGSGTLKLASPDVSPLLRGLALAFPDMAATLPAEASATLAYGTDGLALTDLDAQVGGTKAAGTLRFAPGQGEALTGALDFDRLAVPAVLGLALGPEQPAAPRSAWSNLRFGSGLAAPPRTTLDVKAATLDIAPGLTAHDASFELGLAPDVLTIGRLTADAWGGKLAGSASVRRDGAQAGLEARLDTDGISLDLPGVRGKLSGRVDLAGGGGSPLGLVSSLAGSGTATLADLAIPQADPGALPKLLADVESDDLAVDADVVARAYMDATKVPFDAGTRRFDLALAGGVLSFAPTAGNPTSSNIVDATLDLRQPSLTTRVVETLDALPKGWSGPAPSLVVTWSGAPRAPQRTVDVSAFINAVAARALARESARIEAYELDVRERALFNTRLTAERRRAADKAKAEADAEAARIAKAKREAAARAAAKAAQEKAAQDAQEKAAREGAVQEREERDRAAQGSLPRAPELQGGTPPEPPRFAPAPRGAPADPSAAGRY